VKPIRETKRLAAPAAEPQSLAWDGETLWVGCRVTREIFALDPATWKAKWKTKAPGIPYGMTVLEGELRVLCSENAADNRIIRRCIPYQGFDAAFALPCPDDTGSQLGSDGGLLYVSQWYPKKVIALGKDGKPDRVIQSPHGICGQVWVKGVLHLATTDAEETKEYWLTRIDTRTAAPKAEDLAQIPFAARALAHDGKQFWTNHRERNEIVSFVVE
jgi:hypothetical protein